MSYRNDKSTRAKIIFQPHTVLLKQKVWFQTNQHLIMSEIMPLFQSYYTKYIFFCQLSIFNTDTYRLCHFVGGCWFEPNDKFSKLVMNMIPQEVTHICTLNSIINLLILNRTQPDSM